MNWWTVGTAAAAWLLGRAVLGRRWEGIEVSPGVWRDSVSLSQWATLWVGLAALALVVAGRLPRWPRRLAALLPLLLWIAWSLRGGTLGPIPIVIYDVPTLATWCGGLALGDVCRLMARSVKRAPP